VTQTMKPPASNEWFTPPRVLEAVREVFGGDIDLDPASCPDANEFVQATQYYTKEQNGLKHPWHGRIFLNPPFGKTELSKASNLSYFTHYLIDQYKKGNTKEAILLIPVNTATSWFEPLWQYAICFPTSRIRFLQPDGVQGSGQSFGTCLVYLGPNNDRFIEVFLQFGPVVTPNGVHRRPLAQQPTLF
jgi:hypothetical protein